VVREDRKRDVGTRDKDARERTGLPRPTEPTRVLRVRCREIGERRRERTHAIGREDRRAMRVPDDGERDRARLRESEDAVLHLRADGRLARRGAGTARCLVLPGLRDSLARRLPRDAVRSLAMESETHRRERGPRLALDRAALRTLLLCHYFTSEGRMIRRAASPRGSPSMIGTSRCVNVTFP